MTHGTLTGYIKHSCRCAPCKQAWAVYHNQRRAKRMKLPIPDDVEHGRNSTYINWFCRCRPCRDAHNLYHREYRKRRNAETA